MSRITNLWRNLVHRDRVERELDDELRAAFDLLVEEKVRSGLTEEQARRSAGLELGSVESLKDQVRDVKAGAYIETLVQDVRYAARSLRKTPGFTTVAVATLALGIGANTAIFTLLDAVMLKPLPVPAADELVTLYENAPDSVPDRDGGTGRYLRFSYPRLQRLERALDGYGQLAASTRSGRFVVRIAGAGPTPSRGQLVSARYFETLGVIAARGRVLGHPDVRPEDPQPVAVVSDGFWKRSLGATDQVVGQTIVVNNVALTIVGVTPPGFIGMWTDSAADVWMPLTLQPQLGYNSNSSSYADADPNQPWPSQDRIAWLNVFGRIPTAERARATALLQSANQQGVTDLVEAFTDGQGRKEMLAHTLAVESLAQGFSGLRARFSDTLLALTAMVAIVLLVACANIANLLLTRAAGRARDVCIRLSLGATTSRLVRHYLTESVMLAIAGGGAGLLAGEWASAFLAREVLNTTSELPPAFSPDSRVLVFTIVVSLGTAILFGLAPAIRAIRIGRVTGLMTTQRDAIGRAPMRGMRPLVSGQLALSVVVVFAAILLGRTLINLVRTDPGFAVDRLVAVSFDPSSSGYAPDQVPALHQRLISAARGVPGITSAVLSACGLIRNCTYTGGFNIEGWTTGNASIRRNWIGPSYFTTVGIPILSGREFDERDNARSARVAIVSESMAQRYLAGQDPIGKRVGYDKLDIEIVGVVRDVRAVTVHEAPVPMVYFPIEQPPAFRVAVINLDVRVSGRPEGVVAALRQAIRIAEPALIVDEIGPMSQRVKSDVTRERLVTYLSTSFALLALLLASIGLYGVLSYAVAGRTKEIGVRMALGARSQQVAWMVIRDALTVVAIGLLAGLVAAVAIGTLLKTLLVGVSVSDPATYALMIGVLTVTMLAAAYLPARRAARIDPTRALRAE